jgi:hypothetical protein
MSPTVTKKVVGVFVRFRAPLQLYIEIGKGSSWWFETFIEDKV